jgi:hypothetical protein
MTTEAKILYYQRLIKQPESSIQQIRLYWRIIRDLRKTLEPKNA